ncbi:MAG: hypothetical protein IV100_02035 [Myxococcales bacterium]|nr:hypothetical protein [Myxococcales bacterium]
MAASAKNVISPAKKSEARAAKALLDAHKAGTALLASEELTKNQKLVAGAAIAADKRFVMVTMPTNGQLKLEAGDAFGPFQVLTDFELPLMADGKAHGEFRIEIMAVDLHDADVRQAFCKMFHKPDESMLQQVHEHMAVLEDKRLEHEKVARESAKELVERLVKTAASAVHTAASAAAPGLTESLGFLPTSFEDMKKIITALHKASVASDVLGPNVVITGTFSGGDTPTVAFTQAVVSATTLGDVMTTAVSAKGEANADKNLPFAFFSSDRKYAFQGSPHVTARIEANIVVTVRTN